MTYGVALDRWAEALFDLWESRLADLAAGGPGVESLAALWATDPAVAEAMAQATAQTTGWQSAAADVLKLWLVALTGHAMTANVQAFAPQGAKSGNIDGSPASDPSQDLQGESGRGAPEQANSAGEGKAGAKPRQKPRAKSRQAKGQAEKQNGRQRASSQAEPTPRTKTPRAASKQRGTGLDQPARVVSGAGRGAALAGKAGRSSRQPARRVAGRKPRAR